MSYVTRPCDYCQEDYKAEQRYLNRGQGRFCSQSCSSKRPRKVKEPNVQCFNCDKWFYRTPSKQSISKSGLQFCSRECKEYCQSLEGGVSEIQPDHYGSTSRYRDIALRTYPHYCNRCGYDEVPEILEVNHIDCDRSNNEVENLEILCPTCHALFHFETQTGYWGPRS